MAKVAVFGAGSWGTAFSLVLADAGNEVTLWARREELCAEINEQHTNSTYLADIVLPPSVGATHDPEQAVAGVDAVISSSHACAKAVPVEDGTPHLCYCHTPMRYAWDFGAERERFPRGSRGAARALMAWFRRWDRATATERLYMKAMAAGGDSSRTPDVAARMGREQRNLGPIRAGLIGKGLIYAPEYGVVAFTVPAMADFISRQVD